jgi:hypothetical protein
MPKPSLRFEQKDLIAAVHQKTYLRESIENCWKA